MLKKKKLAENIHEEIEQKQEEHIQEEYEHGEPPEKDWEEEKEEE